MTAGREAGPPPISRGPAPDHQTEGEDSMTDQQSRRTNQTDGGPGGIQPSLVVRPVKAGCPIGGTILDPFAGSGTALAVATGHGRDAIGIDLDHRNADLALDRVGPLMLTVEHPSLDGAALATTPSIVRVSQKRCTKCHLMKPLTEFSPNRHKRDGRQSWCKDCYREQLRRRRAENPALRLRDYNQARAYDQAMRRLRQRHEAEFRSLYDEELGRANSSGDGAA